MHCHDITEFVFKSPLFYSTLAPKHESSVAGNSNTPKRSHKVFPLSEKVESLMLCHNVCITHLTSAHHVGTVSFHISQEKRWGVCIGKNIVYLGFSTGIHWRSLNISPQCLFLYILFLYSTVVIWILFTYIINSTVNIISFALNSSLCFKEIKR